MRVIFLNLPYHRPIVRRYTCTYYSETFLLPPLELMSLSAIAKQEGGESVIIDAVADRLSLRQTIQRLAKASGDCLVSLLGIETFAEDVACLKDIKTAFPDIPIICLGYYPTIFAHKILKHAAFISGIIKGEPEGPFRQMYQKMEDRKIFAPGNQSPFPERIFPIAEECSRIEELDRLPFPDRTGLPAQAYHEFLCPRPFTTLLTARGCPQGCDFCIPTYGRRYFSRSVENVVSEIKQVLSQQDIRMIRFMDDDFCSDKAWIIKFCEMIVAQEISFEWSCLSRCDHLHKELLQWMRKAGCRRIYLGIETFSQRLLKEFGKRTDLKDLSEIISVMHSLGIECVGFFLIGGSQTEKELKEDIVNAIRCDLDHIIVSQLTLYPGTKLFDRDQGFWRFSLFPYELELKDPQVASKLIRWEKTFYRSFYLRFGYLRKAVRRFLLYPYDHIKGLLVLIRYLWAINVAKGKRRDML